MVRAGAGPVEHRIEGDDAIDVRGRQLEGLGHQVQGLVGQVPELVLGDVKHRQQRGLLRWITGEQSIDLLLGLDGKLESHGSKTARTLGESKVRVKPDRERARA